MKELSDVAGEANYKVQDALRQGARALTGGRVREDLGGYFYEPTVLVDVNHGMKVIREETFGPVLPIMKFSTEEEAVRLANDTVYGLTASVWTQDRARGEALARRIEAGTVTVNDHSMTYGISETPWQGFKESGIGRSHSKEGLLEFVEGQHISVDKVKANTRLWWFPYSKGKHQTFSAQLGAMGKK